MNRLLAVVCILCVVACGLIAGLGCRMDSARAKEKDKRTVITANEINLVDEAGKTVITLKADQGSVGIWVEGADKSAVAIYAEAGKPTIALYDLKAKNYKDGFQYAVGLTDGVPYQQTVDKDGKTKETELPAK